MFFSVIWILFSSLLVVFKVFSLCISICVGMPLNNNFFSPTSIYPSLMILCTTRTVLLYCSIILAIFLVSFLHLFRIYPLSIAFKTRFVFLLSFTNLIYSPSSLLNIITSVLFTFMPIQPASFSVYEKHITTFLNFYPYSLRHFRSST